MTWWNVTPDVSAVSSQNFTAIFLHSALRCFESIETSVASRYRSAHLIRANASWDCYQKAISPLCIANNTLSFSVSAGDHLVKCRLEGHGGRLLTLQWLCFLYLVNAGLTNIRCLVSNQKSVHQQNTEYKYW